jgi:soluble lytic murein transglycosylase-like protein
MVADVRNQAVRVLARVTDGIVGNVVPLEVLGVAYDGEVQTKEKEAEAKQQRESQQRAARAARAATSAKSLSSRGGYYARQMQGSVGGGDIPDIARGLSPEAQSVYGIYRNYILKCNPRLSMKDLDEITTSLLFYSQKHKVDPRLVISMIIAESDFDPRSTSNKGAMGLGQIMPDEARDHGVSNPYDVIQNVRTSINLLKMKLDLYYDGAPEGQTSFRQRQLALAAYNAGAGAVKKYGGVPPYKETQDYVKKIERIYRQLCGAE